MLAACQDTDSPTKRNVDLWINVRLLVQGTARAERHTSRVRSTPGPKLSRSARAVIRRIQARHRVRFPGGRGPRGGQTGAVPHRMFHTTTRASAEKILAEGFRDSDYLVGIEEPVPGVSLSKAPVDANQGATGDQVLEVLLPDDLDLVDQYAVKEKGLPIWEWRFPASLLNELANVRLLSEDDLDAIFGNEVLPYPDVTSYDTDGPRRRRD